MGNKARLLFARQLNDALVRKCHDFKVELDQAQALLTAADKVCQCAEHRIPNETRLEDGIIRRSEIRQALFAY
ncbi:hypothetical protein LCGC14_1742450 [marine sediment metagenome]|uniref:Uncharacterized protein n=1 Tax=marine sediment metagenome TaxID=412755 RepID=A0A0F9HTW6_9ZZZZ